MMSYVLRREPTLIRRALVADDARDIYIETPAAAAGLRPVAVVHRVGALHEPLKRRRRAGQRRVKMVAEHGHPVELEGAAFALRGVRGVARRRRLAGHNRPQVGRDHPEAVVEGTTVAYHDRRRRDGTQRLHVQRQPRDNVEVHLEGVAGVAEHQTVGHTGLADRRRVQLRNLVFLPHAHGQRQRHALSQERVAPRLVRRDAHRRLLAHHAVQQVAQQLRRARRAAHVALVDGAHQRRDRRRREGDAVEGEDVARDAQRPHVARLAVVRVAGEHLGREEQRRAVARRHKVALLVQHARDAEVRQAALVVLVQQHVLRLDVAVLHLLVVQVAQRVQHAHDVLAQHRQRAHLARVVRALGRVVHLARRRAHGAVRDVLQDQVQLLAVLRVHHLVQPDEVGVVQVRHDLDLAHGVLQLVALAAHALRQARLVHDLHGERALRLLVHDQLDLGEGPLADGLHHNVLVEHLGAVNVVAADDGACLPHGPVLERGDALGALICIVDDLRAVGRGRCAASDGLHVRIAVDVHSRGDEVSVL
eukprot:PhM_4_TR2114/c2_g2_i2/m.57616